MNELLIIGAGGHSRAVIATLLESKIWKLVGIIDLAYKDIKEDILGVPIIGSLEKLHSYSAQSTSIFLALGSNEIRKSLSHNPIIKNFKLVNVIHSKAHVDPSSYIGAGSFIGPFAHIGPKVIIGSSNIINSYANVEHESVIGHFSQLGPGATICGRCNIGNSVFIGANATIIPNLTIEDSNIIGSGAVINTSISVTGKTFVGVPGKSL
tara:strand:+ start:81 stop:707 length:627 start_codon:yes stop_codon:yes gene_type:complete